MVPEEETETAEARPSPTPPQPRLLTGRATTLAVALVAVLWTGWLVVLPAAGVDISARVTLGVHLGFGILLRLGAAAALLFAAGTATERARVAWLTMAAGCAVSALAALLFLVEVLSDHAVQRTGAGALLGFCGAVVGMIGVLVLPPTAKHGPRRVQLVDTAILAVTAIAIVWALPLTETTGHLQSVAIEISGVATILIAVGTVVRCRPDRNGEIGLLAAAVVIEGLWVLVHNPPPADYGLSTRVADVLAAVGFTLAGAAGLRFGRGVGRVGRTAADQRHLLALPEAATVVTLAALATSAGRHRDLAPSLVIAGVALALISIRMLQLGAEQRQLTTSLQNAADRLFVEARTDALTGLGNRLALDEAMPRSDEAVSALSIDVDGFKRINDALGHAVGDLLLVEVTERIRAVVGNVGAYRPGGDEFVVLLRDAGGQADAVAEAIVDAFDTPVVASDRELVVGVSVGVSGWTPGDSVPSPDLEKLLADAELALRASKARGGGCWTRFEPAFAQRSRRDRLVRGRLQAAASNHDLDVVYEPTVDLATGSLVGVTAKLVWSSDLGSMGPEHVLPIATEGGLLKEVTESVLARVTQLVADIGSPRDGEPTTAAARPDRLRTIGVSLTNDQLMHPAVADLVAEHLDSHGSVQPALGIEVTEAAIADASTLAVVERLRNAGARFAVDRFGTGPSSLFRMDDYPAAAVRLDASFVHGLGRRRNETAIAAAVARLGQSLGMHLSAAGVDEEFHSEFLLRLGFSSGRGRLYPTHLSSDEVVDIVLRQRDDAAPPSLRHISPSAKERR